MFMQRASILLSMLVNDKNAGDKYFYRAESVLYFALHSTVTYTYLTRFFDGWFLDTYYRYMIFCTLRRIEQPWLELEGFY